jgi:hypothetical protein
MEGDKGGKRSAESRVVGMCKQGQRLIVEIMGEGGVVVGMGNAVKDCEALGGMGRK